MRDKEGIPRGLPPVGTPRDAHGPEAVMGLGLFVVVTAALLALNWLIGAWHLQG